MLTVGIIHVLWMLISKIQKNNVQCGCFFSIWFIEKVD
jgi:hypothetical protein